jgi:hypothetical protein
MQKRRDGGEREKDEGNDTQKQKGKVLGWVLYRGFYTLRFVF